MEDLIGIKIEVEHSYTLTRIVNANTFEGRLAFEEENVDVCVQVYDRFEEAVQYIKDLKNLEKAGVPHVVKGYVALSRTIGIKKLGLAFIERVSVINLQDLGLDFWRYGKSRRLEGQERECLGFGNRFRQVFSAIGLGMVGINGASITHGNLLNNGVMVGTDKKVRLCNFSYKGKQQKIKDLTKDIKDFKELIKKSAAEHKKMYPSYSSKNDELTNFLDLYEQRMPTSSEESLREHAKWLYRASIFWTVKDVALLFEMLNELVYVGERLFYSNPKLGSLNCWKDDVRKFGVEKMVSCLDFSLKNKKQYEEKYNIFETSHGIFRFVRNYKHHHEASLSCKGALESVFEVFPNLIGTAYLQIFHAKAFLFLCHEAVPEDMRNKRVGEWILSNLFLDEPGWPRT